MEKENVELECEETFLDFAVLPFAAAKKTEEKAAAAAADEAGEVIVTKGKMKPIIDGGFGRKEKDRGRQRCH